METIESRGRLLKDANHFKVIVANLDFLAQWRFSFEKFLRNSRANDSNRRRSLIVIGSKGCALF